MPVSRLTAEGYISDHIPKLGDLRDDEENKQVRSSSVLHHADVARFLPQFELASGLAAPVCALGFGTFQTVSATFLVELMHTRQSPKRQNAKYFVAKGIGPHIS